MLRVFTEREFPVQWAETQNNLGEAYRELSTGDSGRNLERAIGCYEAVLRFRTEREFGVQWPANRVVNKSLGELQALREALTRSISREAGAKLKALLEEEHIYHQVAIDVKGLISA